MDNFDDKYAPLSADELSATLIDAPPAHDDGEIVSPVPPDAPPAPSNHRRFGNPTMVWKYLDDHRGLLFEVHRFDPPDERKQFLPLSLWRMPDGGLHWRWKGVPAPRPLYNLDLLAAEPDAPVVVVEGEKAADAAARIFPKSIATTSPGGSQAAAKADWKPLSGRRVLIWPDADNPGADYANAVAETLAGLGCEISTIDPMTLAGMSPDGGKREPAAGWDAADAIEEWSDLAALRKTAASLAKPFSPTPMGGPASVSSDIEPLPLRRAPPPGEPFPVEALGRSLGAAALAIVDKVQCAEGLGGASILAAASLAVQAHADVVIPATGQARPLSLFLVSVAASGDRKSSADLEAMRPIRQREQALRDIYDRERPDYLHAKRAFEIALANAEKRSKGDRYEIEEALRAVGDPPREPLLPFLLCEEPSLEGLFKLFERGQPSLGLFSDEGGGFLGGYALSQENRLKTLAGLSMFWDGATVRRIRAGDGASALLGRRLAFHLMVQPEAASGLLSDTVALDQGFLSRVLVSAPPSRAGSRLQKPIAPETEDALRKYDGVLRDLLEKPAPIAPGATNVLEPRRLAFDGRASAGFLRLCDEIEKKLGHGGAYEPIRGFANKLPEHIARIAGVLTLADNVDAGAIGADALARAATLGDYFASEALRLFEAGAASPDIMRAEKALAWLLARGNAIFGLATLYQFGPNCIRDAATARRTLETLEANGWVTRLEGTRHRVDGKTVREAWRLTARTVREA